jgi:hypothetical protein
MFIVFRLISILIDGKKYEIRSKFNGNIKLSDINRTFIAMGFTELELSEFKFVIDNRIANDLNKEYNVADDEEKIIIIIPNNNNLIKSKLGELFIKHGTEIPNQEMTLEQKMALEQRLQFNNNSQENKQVDSDINKPLTKITKEIPTQLTQEMIDNMNMKTIKLFSDDDFKSLLHIYMKKPELFNTLSLFVQNNDLTENVFEKTEEKNDYNLIISEFKKINLDVSEEEVKKYNGHMNLILRSILVNKL